jgi:arabinofuranosyltransferase
MRRFPTLLTNLISVKPSLTIQQDATEEEQADASTIDERKGSSVYRSGKEKSILAGSLTIFLIIVAKNAWLSDDSYITFRTVDNFVHGYGLTWNIDERVQTYTHPLWMFLISALYFCTREIYYSVLFLSLTISFVAIGIFAEYIAKSLPMAVMGIALLAASKSYVDYSTSGLENPLTHLLIILFVLVYFSTQRNTRSLFWLALIAGLATLNRMDTLLLFVPPLLYLLYRYPKLAWVKAMLLGFLPFLLWEVFSLWYYGFLFPNTAYAKLDTGFSSAQLLHHGIGYLISSFTFDPILFICIAASFMFTLILEEWDNMPFLIGIGLYILYTVKVGGDFMAGRFLTAPFLVAVLLLARGSYPPLKWVWVAALAVAVLCGFLTPNSRWYPIITSKVLIDTRGVADEHAFYNNATGIFTALRGLQVPNYLWAQQGLQARLSNQKVVKEANLGFFGFEAGPFVHIVDPRAISDPLLARLPARSSSRIGHFTRYIPDGYLETLETGKNLIEDKDLALYYDKLRFVTRGPLFDIQRLIEIWKLNTGAYDYLLNAYNIRHPAGR